MTIWLIKTTVSYQEFNFQIRSQLPNL